MDALTTRPRWWLITLGLLRAAVNGAVMVALYYVLALQARSSGYLILELIVGLALLVFWSTRSQSFAGSSHRAHSEDRPASRLCLQQSSG